MKRLLMLTISLFVSASANAAFSVYMPLEAQSILFNKPVHQTEPEPVQEKLSAELCDDKIQPTINFVENNYTEINYVSHEFNQFGCVLTISLPKAKSFYCTGSNDYSQSTTDIIFERGFNGVLVEYYGSCS